MSATWKLDLLPAQLGRAGQCRELIKSPGELRHSLYQRRPRQRPLSGFAPQACGLLDQPSLGAMTRQQLWLVFGNLSELILDCFGNTSVQRPSRLTQ